MSAADSIKDEVLWVTTMTREKLPTGNWKTVILRLKRTTAKCTFRSMVTTTCRRIYLMTAVSSERAGKWGQSLQISYPQAAVYHWRPAAAWRTARVVITTQLRWSCLPPTLLRGIPHLQAVVRHQPPTAAQTVATQLRQSCLLLPASRLTPPPQAAVRPRTLAATVAGQTTPNGGGNPAMPDMPPSQGRTAQTARPAMRT